ncbi:hypothetical protein CE91St62_39050 [Lachnospiraceae bacterium]|uniref:hypothetical protein n=1 Tax=Extibacter sp. GGCC_0201 TaxID=2731209 RepID=UPI001AA1A541|nr:hypothetical protein [Extibacter sp. GGCC_0201]MBO1720732.1 hypothetical protein [Extibacter sp. GGCC_0201]BDF35843.1 hypothetical protein CE91St61_39180 [Lachnospiraceae bacterium]BDF39844.1 hypothetical protein CE91St62_39050 [Lachnospiraceae bacterium]
MKKAVLGIIVCMAGIILGFGMGKYSAKELSTQKEESGISAKNHEPWVRKSAEPAKSKLKKAKECYLCGNSNRSLMGLFRKYDDLGIICVNNWYVIDMKIRNHADDGSLTGPRGGMNTTYTATGEGGCFFHSSPNSDRGIATMEITYGDDSIFQVKNVQKHLCQECLDKILAVMETYEPESKPWKPRDLCLVDFNTLELYSLQGDYTTYYIGDYYVQIDTDKEDRMEVTAIYAPVLENGHKEGE